MLVGHSLGAAAVGDVARQHPHDVRRVIFADGDGLKVSTGPRWLRTAILDSPYVTTLLRIGSHRTWLDTWFIQTACGPRFAPPTTALAHEWVRPLHQLTDEHALHNLLLNADNGLTPDQISAIAVPSSIIWGSDDHDGGYLRDIIVNPHHPTVHLIDHAGHLTMIASPRAFARAVDPP
jgi:pimeloyl-ACP methyl ester carboxylesterase